MKCGQADRDSMVNNGGSFGISPQSCLASGLYMLYMTVRER
jgi:hypothetical protein